MITCVTKRSPQRGFTLLETILALMIFSIAVVSLVGAINGMGNASTEARRTREVQAQLETLILEITRHVPQEIVAGQRSYEKSTNRDGVEYRIAMAAVELTNQDGQPLQGIYSVKAEAHWTDGGHKEALNAETMLFPPLYYNAPR
jgi:prepilin-type N-terminal cleavage/methylation domain-containing protein